MRYLVSGHNDNSTFDVCVNKLPVKPPPDTSHVTKQSLCALADSHAMFVATKELSRTIDVTPNDQVAWIGLFIFVDSVQSSQHCKRKKKEKLKICFNKTKKMKKDVSFLSKISF